MAVVKTRLIVGFSIAFTVVGLLVLDIMFNAATLMAILVAFCVAAALYEFYVMVEKKGIKTFAGIGMITAVFLVLGEYLVNHYKLLGKWEYANALLLLLFLLIFSIFFILVLQQRVEGALTNLAVTIFGIIYIWGLASFILRLRFLQIPFTTSTGQDGWHDVGLFLVLLTIAVSKLNDSTAFFVGRAFGVRKLAPKISPGKSIVGLVGGLFGGIAGGFAVYYIFRALSSDVLAVSDQFTPVFILIFSILVGAVSHIGDLAESLLKRDIGVKDSAALFPEAGGFLDLIDGLLFAGPVAFFVTVFLTSARFQTFDTAVGAVTR